LEPVLNVTRPQGDHANPKTGVRIPPNWEWIPLHADDIREQRFCYSLKSAVSSGVAGKEDFNVSVKASAYVQLS
jgi:hypothetical protein